MFGLEGSVGLGGVGGEAEDCQGGGGGGGVGDVFVIFVIGGKHVVGVTEELGLGCAWMMTGLIYFILIFFW